MEEKLVEFANLLRENGVRVSLAETLDAFSASEVTGLGERDVFRSALRSTMVKRASELPVFEELFDVYFSGLGEIIKQASKAVQDALSMSDQEFQKFLEDVEKMLQREGKKLSELAKQLLQNNSGALEKRLRDAAPAERRIRLGDGDGGLHRGHVPVRHSGVGVLPRDVAADRDRVRRATAGPEHHPPRGGRAGHADPGGGQDRLGTRLPRRGPSRTDLALSASASVDPWPHPAAERADQIRA